ncbi:MAG TPA: class I SAM-dependent methyltransferase [Pseudolabrys sp.]|uniref:class I SAM-dependent methyltransferase n=1 Tax=Pseudolabrys sp. TaxID=1960880 RepID=UPI002DDCCB71|nr:class I SAM-dependent methyltransferase [Pseudolabrys sp.]HEV2629196.1 class I SAM-dependent methyltransferase [Pseudolabrys sp.]
MSLKNLKNVRTHFAFGKNWASYASLIDEPQIEEAARGLLKLVPLEDFKNRSFLDIGCGSGLHALGAARLGVSRILAIDIDPDSVATSDAVLSHHNVAASWQVETTSVFDLDASRQGTFDVVYSWGVLHHTGSMWEAIGKAASMVAPSGLLAIALYRKTRTDTLWKMEKRLYSRMPRLLQGCIRAAYIGAFRFAMVATGRKFREYVANYRSSRGMDFYHDVHDWLGGYPFETASASEVESELSKLGFKPERIFARPITTGIFGSGCDEFVYRLQK